MGLCFERLNASSNQSNENVVMEEHALFSGQYKGKCRNCGQIGHKAAQCKKKLSETTETWLKEIIVLIVVGPAMWRKIVSS